MSARTRLFFLLVLVGMLANAALCLIFLLPSSPLKMRVWGWFYSIVLPYLGCLGGWGWWRNRDLDLPLAIPVLLVLYFLLMTIWVNSFYVGLAGLVARLPSGSSELLPIFVFIGLLTGVLFVLRREYYW
jgi:hypothetical protein